MDAKVINVGSGAAKLVDDLLNSGFKNVSVLGDGVYSAMTTVDVPTFQRALIDKGLWSEPVSAKFHFRLKDGKITEVSQLSRVSW